jgi:methionyl-tRNA formyltransferase
LVAGPKGAFFLRSIDPALDIVCVTSYPSRGLRYDAFAEIRALCEQRRLPYRDFESIKGREATIDADLIFMVGWQWLLSPADGNLDERFIVLHDSLLPKLRGFNPTVTAIIAGDSTCGVTAFRPDGGVDSGPMCGQRALELSGRAKIGETYERLGELCADLVCDVAQQYAAGTLQFTQQPHVNATYSLWRGEDDYEIDWSLSAERICRFVAAVGWPYLGAKTAVNGNAIRVDRIEPMPDLDFPLRQPGKIWSLRDGTPSVVCGSGMVNIVEARDERGDPYRFTALRTRLGAPRSL